MGIPSLINDENVYFTDKDKAEVLNEKFQSVFTHECFPLPSKESSPFPSIPHISIGTNGVKLQLLKLNTNKASGPDEIPARILKETAVSIAPIISSLYQQSIDTGSLPEEWTHALVTAVYKKGKKSDPLNYRPISLTCLLVKVLEHIVLSHTWKHLHEHNIISKVQHGFQSGLSCETQLVEAVDDWARAIDKNRQVDVVLLDFSSL